MDNYLEYETSELINYLPENTPLYKDSGLWQFRTDDMENVIIDQNHNENFRDFILRYIELLKEFKNDDFLLFETDLMLNGKVIE